MTKSDLDCSKIIQFFSFALLILAIAKRSDATTIIRPWQPIFQGIDYSSGSLTDNNLHQLVNVLRIDLSNPHIHFFSTPKTAQAPRETLTQTTSDFLRQYKLQVAVNANYFLHSSLPISGPTNLIGLAISNGQTVHPTIQGNTTALIITQKNLASIVNYPVGSIPNGVYTAVSGIPELLKNNQILLADKKVLDSRTAAGISKDGKYLILLTIDGARPGVSDGATLYQTAQWLQRYGAYNAVNLDGGSSSTMVREDVNGSAKVLNRPRDFGIERLVGNNLGISTATIDPIHSATIYSGEFLVFGLGVSLLRLARD